MSQHIEDPRRAFLVQALGWGLFGAVTSPTIVQPVYALGDIPAKLPPGRSIYKIQGNVSVDGKPADINTIISASSLVKTGNSSRIIFVVGSDAFILRSNSELQLGGSGFLIETLRMMSGKLLSVFGERKKPHRITTLTATIGIRGTGIYVESDAEQSYICTCYGHTLISSNQDQSVQQEIISKHHDDPLYVLSGNNSKIIRPAPFINHTDVELALIEELVGRTPPFAFASDSYATPRKRNY